MKAYDLFMEISGIDDAFLSEAEMYNIAQAKREKVVKYGAWGLAVSLGVAAIAWGIRRHRAKAA